MTTDWGTLAVIATANFFLLDRDPRRLRPVLDAGLRYWKTYSALGERYSSGSEKGVDLWRERNSLKIIFGAMGVPSHIARQPLPPDGPAGLLKHATKQI